MAKITEEMTQSSYLAAVRALRRIVADPGVTAAAEQEASDQLDRLNADFVGWATTNVVKRTAAYGEFVANMEKVVAALSAQADIDGLKRLKAIIDEAKTALGEKPE
jgi:hypothetical protein